MKTAYALCFIFLLFFAAAAGSASAPKEYVEMVKFEAVPIVVDKEGSMTFKATVKNLRITSTDVTVGFWLEKDPGTAVYSTSRIISPGNKFTFTTAFDLSGAGLEDWKDYTAYAEATALVVPAETEKENNKMKTRFTVGKQGQPVPEISAIALVLVVAGILIVLRKK